ncbi:MAG: hypothetical protein IPH16_17500 [Haliscomenobacter sp.]|nr:hypothetical protein [Haliscomenobacter sp.]
MVQHKDGIAVEKEFGLVEQVGEVKFFQIFDFDCPAPGDGTGSWMISSGCPV